MGLFSFKIFVVGSERCIFSAIECTSAVQGHPKSSKIVDFGTNRKGVCDFLLVTLVINSNFGPILHCLRYGDSLAENPIPLSYNAFARGEPFGISDGLSVGEDFMILACVVLIQYQRVTDGQTSRPYCRPMAKGSK